MPSISIIIPVYNAEKYIKRCLDSVLSQTFQNFEVIIVNDGSTDSSLELCKGYADKDSRIVVLDKANGGAASARNLGMEWFYENSESKWLCFVDIDDFIHEKYLEILLTAATETQTEVSMCSYEITHKDTLECRVVKTDAECIGTEELWCKNQVFCTVPVVKLFDRNAFCDVRFPEGIIHEDEFTLFRALFKYERIAFVDQPLYGYYQTEQSVMRGDWTPRHMTEPEGLLSQLEFFLENKYEKASAYTAKIYLTSLYRNLVKSREAGAQYGSYSASLKKQLQRGLTKYGRLAGVKIENSKWMYYEAYPIATIPYRAYKKCFGGRKREGE